MRILYFSRDYTPHDYRFLTALAQTPHQVFYLRLERRGNATEDRALPAEIKLVPWEGGQQSASLKDGSRLLLGVRRVLQKIKPDIVHAGPIQTAAFLTALSGFRRLVSVSWGYDLLYDVQRGSLWRWAARYTLKRSAAFVGDCDTVRQQAIKYGMRPERIVTFPWGVDLTHFTPGAVEKPADAPFTILSTRAWEPLYGVEVIARAFAQASQAHPELQLVMTGHGSLASRLRQIFERAGVSEKVLFPGHIRQADLPRYYRSADLYVSASHSDGSSISLLEAMACGIPVLVSAIPGNCEWVQEGVQGWLFPDGDAQALAQAISHAAENRPALAGLGKAARSQAEKRANWNLNFPRLLQAYEMAMA